MNHQAASYLKPKPPKVAFCLPRVTSTQHRRAPLKENQPYHLNWIRNQAVNLVTSNCLMQQMKARLTHQLEPDSTVLAPVTSSFAASEKVWMPLRSQGPDCQHKRHQNKWTLSLFLQKLWLWRLWYLAISLCHLVDMQKTNHILISCEEFCQVFILICNQVNSN